ncbi:MAG: hypothetical protein WC054_10180 [Candidatus Nanopelagicales bacterium]
MSANDPATLAAQYLQDLPVDDGKPVPNQALPDNETELVIRVAGFLTQVSSCIGRLETGGEDMSPMRSQMPLLWGSLCVRKRVSGADAAINTLLMFGVAIRRAKLVTDFTAEGLDELSRAIGELEELVRDDTTVSAEFKDRFFGLIAQARRACDDIDLVGPMSVDEGINDLAAATVVYSEESSDQTAKEKAVKILKRLCVSTAYAAPLEIASQAAQAVIGS